jgi:hypothetical protein
MSPFITVGLLAVAGGFLVAWITALSLGKQKASRLPGGSLTSGFAVALSLGHTQFGFILYGAFLGIVGWLIWIWLVGRR